MKKISIILLLVCLYATNLKAQTSYVKMLDKDTTTWQHFGFMYGVKSSEVLTLPNVSLNSFAAIDTITIGSFLYKKLYEVSTWANPIYYPGKVLFGYLREDTIAKKVFYRENLSSNDILLYDFSLNLNDSTFLNFPLNPSLNGYYRVDSIKVKNEVAGPRKHFYLRKHVNNSNHQFYYFDHIEGIGNTYHFAYLFQQNLSSSFVPINISPTCKHLWEFGLACKHNKNKKQYQSCTYVSNTWNYKSDSCSFAYITGSLTENTLNNSFYVYPNPSSERFNIKFENSIDENIKVNITSTLGQTLNTENAVKFNFKNNEIYIDIKSLKSGMYFIKLELKGKEVYYPIYKLE